ncbi:MAG TPA: fructose-6-phosphate aldolase [Armatimonadota bacterium]|nr:fructose-6-phosphate aldolase [Armatimonadota bacterium]
MKLFVDTASVAEIREAHSWGVIDGVTTNPSLVAKEGVDFKTRILEICDIVDGPISAETVQLRAEEMVPEAREIAAWHPNVHVKIPMTREGMKALKVLSAEGIKTNVTLVFSLNQALLAAKNGATFVSVFLGRVDDIGGDGMAVVRQCVDVFENYGFDSQVLAASIRHPLHVVQAAEAGAHISTVPYKVIKQMFEHPLTDIGLERFLADWEKAMAELKVAKA